MNESHSKSDLVHKLKELHPDLTLVELKDVLDSAFNIMAETLESGKDVRVHHFGVFKCTQRKQREARNPKTNEKIHIAAKRVVRFVPSSQLKTALNK